MRFESRQERAYGQGGSQRFVQQGDSGFDSPASPLSMKPLPTTLAGSDSENLEFPSGHARKFGGLTWMSIGTIEISWIRRFFLCGFPPHLSWTQDGADAVLFEDRLLKEGRDGCWGRRRCGVGPLRRTLFLPAPIFSWEKGNVPFRFCQERTFWISAVAGCLPQILAHVVHELGEASPVGTLVVTPLTHRIPQLVKCGGIV